MLQKAADDAVPLFEGEGDEGVTRRELDIVGGCFQVFMEELGAFADSAAAESGASKGSADAGELAKLYFRYLTEKIATRIKREGLEKEMEGLVAREKRPVLDFLALQNALASAPLVTLEDGSEGYWPDPKFGLLSRLFGNHGNDRVMHVTAFNAEFTGAYLSVVAGRVSEDVFRIQAVRLLERLVFESIAFSLNMFSAGSSVEHEAMSMGKEVGRLERCREVLQQALDESK